MDYDYRKAGGGAQRPGGGPSLAGYDSSKMYAPRFDRVGSNSQLGGNTSHFYPRIAQPVGPATNRAPAPVSHSSPTSGTGIRVCIKPEYRVAPAVQLILPQNADVSRSLFNFDFELERKILVEFERESQGWDSGRANGEASPAPGSGEDPIVAKYVGMGLSREAVVMGVAAFGDAQSKVVDFVSSYNLLREMGFPSTVVAGALAMYDNDREKALAHFV
ncbi:unnamed protein product [Calypogeia fissa]